MTEELKLKVAQLTPDELADLLTKDDISDEDKELIAVEVAKAIGIKVASLTLLTTTRYLKMQKGMKAIIEEDGEIYKVELKKITDITPEKGIRQYDKDISQSLTVTVENFE